MSELFPSLTAIIVCSILGIGCAWGFYKNAISNEGRVIRTAVILGFLLFVFANFATNQQLFSPKILGVFLLALFIGLMSTPIDD